MPREEAPEPSRGAMPGPTRGVAPTVSVEGIVESGFRPGQGASNPDWNSGENNLGMYRDPAEVAWERQERARQMEENTQTTPNQETEANGSAAVQQPSVPKRGRGRPKKSVQDSSARASRSVDVPVSDVSRDRDADETKLQEVRKPRAHQGREATGKSGDLAVVSEAQWNKHRLEAVAGISAYENFIQNAPLKDAFTLFNEVSRRVVDSGQVLEDRRTAEKKTENSCSFCDHVFTYRGTDSYKARRAFDLPDGRIQVVMSCSKSKCLDEFDQYVNDMSLRSRETLH